MEVQVAPEQVSSVDLLRKSAVQRKTGLSDSEISRRVRAGKFPAPVRVGVRAVAWRSDQVDAWIAGLPKAVGAESSQ
ncbi:MAG: AlpA family phage regulatory protein [Burkholderiaceae bacterium]|nr:AlpA family phage regulatory protein [Burkholderiaceae bacterium]